MKKFICLMLALMMTAAVLPVANAAEADADLFYFVLQYSVDPENQSLFADVLSGGEWAAGVSEIANPDELDEETLIRLSDACEFDESNYDALLSAMKSFYEFSQNDESGTTAFLLALLKRGLPQTNIYGEAETEMATLIDFANEGFYSFYGFFAALDAANLAYSDTYGRTLLTLLPDFEITFDINYTAVTALSGEYLEAADDAASSDFLAFLESFIEFANTPDNSYEQGKLILALDDIGAITAAADETSDDGGVDAEQYEMLRQLLASQPYGEFADPERTVSEYIDFIKNGGRSASDKAVLRRALSDAATISLTGSGRVMIGEDALEFAYMNQTLAAEIFAREGVTVYSDVPRYLKIVSETQPQTVQVGFLPEVFRMFELFDIDGVIIAAEDARMQIEYQAIKDLGYTSDLSGGLYFTMRETVPVLLGSDIEAHCGAARVAWEASFITNEGVVTDDFDASAITVIINEERLERLTTDSLSINNIYTVSEDGAELVNSYYYDDMEDVVSFAKGAGRYFAFIPEEKIDDTETDTDTEIDPNADRPDNYDDGTGSTGSGGNTGTNTGSGDGNGSTTKPNNVDSRYTTGAEGDDGGEKTETDLSVSTWGFADVPDSHWGKIYIQKLVQAGILAGMGNNMFAPDANITREQFVKIVVDALGIRDDDAVCDFDDVSPSAWYYASVASAVNAGLINGLGDGKFGSGENISRQDMAVILMRAAEKYDKFTLKDANKDVSFTDEDEIAAYAKDAVTAFARAGIISGMGNGAFAPRANATRAQAAKIVYMLMY